MSKKNYNRELFIYETNNSLTNEICEEIIMNFTNDACNDILYSNFLDNKWNRIIKSLKKQLLTHFNIYLASFNKPFICNLSMNYNMEFRAISIDLNQTLEKFVFVIKKVSSEQLTDTNSEQLTDTNSEQLTDTNSEQLTDTKFVRQSKIEKSIKLFQYIWFLNDYDGEMVFWREHSIKPKAGKLVIFPTSWCFPYEDFTKKSDKKYYIKGQIQAAVF
jgi:hypothetical protein